MKNKQQEIQKLQDWYNNKKENPWRHRIMTREDILDMYEFVLCNPRKIYTKDIHCLREGHEIHEICKICHRMPLKYIFNGECERHEK